VAEITFVGKPAGMGPKGTWVFLDLPKEITNALGTKARAPRRRTKAALAQSPKAKPSFDWLAPSHRKAYVDWIEEAKRPETQDKRVTETVARLARGEKRT